MTTPSPATVLPSPATQSPEVAVAAVAGQREPATLVVPLVVPPVVPTGLGEQAAMAVWERCEAALPDARARAVLERAAPGARVDDRPLGVRDGLLLEVYRATFGGRVEATVTCLHCGQLLEVSFDVGAVRCEPAASGERFPIVAEGLQVSCRLPTPADLAAAGQAGSHAAARRILIERCVEATDEQGQRVAASELAGELVGEIAAEMARRDPQAAVELALACDACGREQLLPFAVEDFLWRRVATSAARLLDDVHDLALAYGWSEAETLAVPAGRRRRYLERVNR